MSLLDDLGIDPEDFTWEQLAGCVEMPVNWFYDDYENDSVIARNVESVCRNCPVIRPCAEAAMDNKEEGLWGGIYWNNGKVDKVRNRHKTPEDWAELEERIGRKIPR
jgi:hypothetical protein